MEAYPNPTPRMLILKHGIDVILWSSLGLIKPLVHPSLRVLFRIAAIQGELNNPHQGEETIAEYFNRMEKLRLELESFRSMPRCFCVTACLCTLIPSIIAQKESDYVIMFLRGLNDSFANIRSQIMMMSPFPDIEKVFNILS
jgi:hypothetical protein